MTVRRILESDLPAVVRLVHALAHYERAPESCHLTVAQLHQALFTDSPAAFAHVAVEVAQPSQEEKVVGFALWFRNFSTWDGVHGIYLEDLFVEPEYRGRGHGRALLRALAAECIANGYTRLQWSCLDWNKPALDFYETLGAVATPEWIGLRLTGEALHRLGAEQ